MSPSTLEMAQAEQEVVTLRQFQEKVTNEEFKIWKRTVPLLYDTIHTIVIDSPSVSVLWLPSFSHVKQNKTVSVGYVLGTYSLIDGGSIQSSRFELPLTLAPDFAQHYTETSLPIAADPAVAANHTTTKKWKQKSAPTVVRVSPNGQRALSFHQSGHIRSTKLQDEEASITEYKYHKQEGSCLEWMKDTEFLSGGNDSQIALWNAAKPSTPMRLFKAHSGSINGLSLNKRAPSIFGSVADDSITLFHDVRTSAQLDPVISVQNNHIQNTIAIHPDLETMYVTAGQDNVINLYDLRNPKAPYRVLHGHNDSVLGAKWDAGNDPFSLVSWGLDRRVNIWDLSNLDAEFTYPTDATSGGESSRRKSLRKMDPCLKFVHAGHTQRVNDVDMHPEINNLYISIGQDKLVEIWKPKTIVLDGESHEGTDLESNEVPATAGSKSEEDSKSEKESESERDREAGEKQDGAADVEMAAEGVQVESRSESPQKEGSDATPMDVDSV